MNNNIVKSRKKSGIYQILNLKNNKVYIGQTNNLLYRRSQHFRSLKDNKHYNNYLQRAFNKFGEKLFVFEVLEYCCTEELNVRERYWIEEKKVSIRIKATMRHMQLHCLISMTTTERSI
ncbi:GIY-YIG nuclease family protein [Peribacillus sp. NPDC060253]|uniref:GIY-YIG nuclease family protein n=1 Tax=Peribacillus sp. NPDC060253 TaxID=3347084 RepID=UPI0036631176